MPPQGCKEWRLQYCEICEVRGEDAVQLRGRGVVVSLLGELLKLQDPRPNHESIHFVGGVQTELVVGGRFLQTQLQCEFGAEDGGGAAAQVWASQGRQSRQGR